MKIFVGLDVAKDLHWACAIDHDARPLFSRSVANDPAGIAEMIGQIEALRADEVTVALDLLGGIATLVCAMVAEAGFRLVHTPGLSVNRARQGMRGGENKSDPRDAATIAELARTRPGLRMVDAGMGSVHDDLLFDWEARAMRQPGEGRPPARTRIAGSGHGHDVDAGGARHILHRLQPRSLKEAGAQATGNTRVCMFFHYFIHFMGYVSFFHPRARARGQGALREILKEVRGAGLPL
jgi:hypothetical protein